MLCGCNYLIIRVYFLCVINPLSISLLFAFFVISLSPSSFASGMLNYILRERSNDCS